MEATISFGPETYHLRINEWKLYYHVKVDQAEGKKNQD